MFPTAAGEAFLARARRALDEMAAATTDSSALSGATVARGVHTIIGLAASGVGVGLGPSRMRAVPRPGVRFCEVTPCTPLPGLILSFASRAHSPVLRAFLIGSSTD